MLFVQLHNLSLKICFVLLNFFSVPLDLVLHGLEELGVLELLGGDQLQLVVDRGLVVLLRALVFPNLGVEELQISLDGFSVIPELPEKSNLNI